MRQAPEFERMLVRQGIHLFNSGFGEPPGAAQAFKGARGAPLIQWKLSPSTRPRSTSGTSTPRPGSDVLPHRHHRRAWIVIKCDARSARALRHALPGCTAPLTNKNPETIAGSIPHRRPGAGGVRSRGARHHRALLIPPGRIAASKAPRPRLHESPFLQAVLSDTLPPGSPSSCAAGWHRRAPSRASS